MRSLRGPFSLPEPGRGSILIVALWTLLLLAALVVAIVGRASSALDLARRVGERTSARYLARAGQEQACAILLGDTNGWDALGEAWSRNEPSFRDVAMDSGSFSLSWVDEREGGSVTNYGLADEERRINLNEARREVLRSLFVRAAGLDDDDADDQPESAGAETDYYQGLHPGYSCHNGNLETIEELLLIKGVAPAIFQRVADYVTVYGGGKVNLNTAGSAVLLSRRLAEWHDG